MHEEALFKDLRRKFEEIAAGSGGQRIVRVTLWIGALSHLTEDHLKEDWPRVVEGTAAEAAALQITVSNDLNDPNAQSIILVSVGVE